MTTLKPRLSLYTATTLSFFLATLFYGCDFLAAKSDKNKAGSADRKALPVAVRTGYVTKGATPKSCSLHGELESPSLSISTRENTGPPGESRPQQWRKCHRRWSLSVVAEILAEIDHRNLEANSRWHRRKCSSHSRC